MKIVIDKAAIRRDTAVAKKKLALLGKSLAKSTVKSADAVAAIPKSIKNAVSEIEEEVKTFRDRDPAAKSNAEVVILYSGLHAILAYRVSHKLYLTEHYFSARAISQVAKFFTGIEIHPGATIGRRFFIDHGAAVVIGETAEIGDDCTIYQGVTLGGTGKDVGKRHPTLGNNVMVGAGAKVLGPMRIGDNTKVAAGAVVLGEIPDNCTAVGIPAKVVKREGIKIDDLDQVHIPDPVDKELKRLEERIKELEEKLGK
ncbi:MAG: serine O-acetyltransferase EpsC [Clostridia bacterium]|nr:serine O-acetyltransferase EpsC [Clostridia bacterium]